MIHMVMQFLTTISCLGHRAGASFVFALKLRTWIASEVQKESSVLKERREAREERVLANPKKKGGKGGAGGEG